VGGLTETNSAPRGDRTGKKGKPKLGEEGKQVHMKVKKKGDGLFVELLRRQGESKHMSRLTKYTFKASPVGRKAHRFKRREKKVKGQNLTFPETTTSYSRKTDLGLLHIGGRGETEEGKRLPKNVWVVGRFRRGRNALDGVYLRRKALGEGKGGEGYEGIGFAKREGGAG